jgi:hypothetical protein
MQPEEHIKERTQIVNFAAPRPRIMVQMESMKGERA